MKSVCLFSLILLMTCCNWKPDKTLSQDNIVNKEVSPTVKHTSLEIGQSVVEGAIGLITTSDNYQFGDTINIFDKDGKVQKQISFTDENQVLSLKCLSKDGSCYKVEFENNDIGFVPKSEKGVLFQTWEEHILSVFSVDFNEATNPLRKAPSESAEKLYYDKDEFYHPSQIKREWLQVKWGSEDHWKYGWFRWKDGEKLLIELYYFA